MTITLVFLGIIMATVIGWLLRQTLNSEPWKTDDPLENQPGRGVLNIEPAKIGLISFIAVATSLFGLFLSAYMMRMKFADWTALSEPKLLWLNTGLLVLASIAFQLTRNAARRAQVLAAARQTPAAEMARAKLLTSIPTIRIGCTSRLM